MLFTLALSSPFLAALPLQTPPETSQEVTRRIAPARAAHQAPLPNVDRAPHRPNQPEIFRPEPDSAEVQRPGRDRPDEAAIRAQLNPYNRRSVLHHDVIDGTHWVRGATYKASASADGFRYIPALGSKAPRNFPVHFRLDSAERDGATFELSPEASVKRSGERFILDRGDVEVRYDLALDQVEQSFAFNAPGGSGDVLLRLSVVTELEAQEAGGGALRFENAFGGMNYSEAIVLDGAGRQAAVTSTWRDGAIELTVPAAFIEAAIGPIIVDPVLDTIIIDDFSEDLDYPDLAYDIDGDRYLAVYEERFSATDVDVYSQFLDGITLTASGGAYVEISVDNWARPKVAQNRFSGRFLVVAEGPSVAQPGSVDIVARFRLADGTLEAPFVVKSATSSFSCATPDVGGESIDLAFSTFCVAYARDYGTDTDTHAIILSSAGVSSGTEINLSTNISRTDTSPSVSKSTGNNSAVARFNIAWGTRDLNTDETWVQAAQISFGGGTVFGPFDVSPRVADEFYFDVEVSDTLDTVHPVTGERYWAVSYDDDSSIVTDAFVALLSGQTVHSIEELQVIEHHPKAANENDVVIGNRSDYFLFAYVASGTVFATMAQPIVDRLGMTERRLEVDGSTAVLGTLAIASTFSGGANFNDSALIWSQSDGTSLNIAGTRALVDVSLEASGSQYCFGSPNSTGDHAFMRALGNRDRFSPQTLVTSSLPLSSFGFFLASTTQGFTPGAGGSAGTLCVSMSVGRFGIFNAGSGGRGLFTLDPQAIAQPTGAVSATSGSTWNFQTWHRDAVGGTATSNFSNAVAITFL